METSQKKYFYSNSSKIAGSPYDINMIFERSSAPELPANFNKTEPLEPIIVESLEVSMSPSHAKAVVIGLLHALSNYETTFGSIPMPPEKNNELKALLKSINQG